MGCIMFTSSSVDARNNMKCQETVETTYPDAIVYPIPEEKYLFIVARKNCEVLLVTTLDAKSTKITSVNVIKHAD